METKNSHTTGHTCPYCNQSTVDTFANAPYVRGYILAYQKGSKPFFGCNPCVRKKVLGEAGLSALIGWFSISSLIVNPFMIIYNLFQGLTVKPDPAKVQAKFKEFGIPDHPGEVNILAIGYSLAVSMIAADGKIEEEEVRVAQQMGGKILPGFNQQDFKNYLDKYDELPGVPALASFLKDNINDATKDKLYQFLAAIASADGEIAEEEATMLKDFASNLAYIPRTH